MFLVGLLPGRANYFHKIKKLLNCVSGGKELSSLLKKNPVSQV